ncbi:hypothetical protein [Algoriphagus taiwanensis]|uniref:Uncharacterized protein n=1 Tax=Algoriphagus taiwanensis TaxID=1445656 RepID=A0ABQ6PZD8_9BACT|nr:hypothetical protein Ataiwa_15660 [Algoriphagus taiwanensis]
MKTRSLFLLFGLMILSLQANSQSAASWELPMIEVKFQESGGENTLLKVDPGFQYADLHQGNRTTRMFYHKNYGIIKNARIIDQNSKQQIARGKGSYFWGNARFEFESGEVFKLKRKRSQNGHEIIGPYGPLFLVENFGIKPIKTLNERDFIAQSFFVFDQIKTTQKPPSDLIYLAQPVTMRSRGN